MQKQLKVKVTHFTTVHNRFDTRILYKECATLARNGYEVVLYVADGQGDEEKLDVRIVDNGKRCSNRINRALISGCKMFFAVLRSRASIFHFHDPELIPFAILMTLLGKKVIYDVHEDVPKQILSKHWLPRVLRNPIAHLAKLAELMSGIFLHRIVTATPPIAKRFPVEKTTTVQNFPAIGVDTDLGVGNCYRQPYAIYVGAIGVTRGIREVIKALALLPDESPLRLKLAGKFGPSSLEYELREYDGWRRVDYLGWLARPEVNKLLKQASCGIVTLHPTPNYVEAYPVKLFEYMSAGVPSVASDFPLWRSIVTEFDSGILVDPMSPEDIAKALEKLVSEPALVERLGGNGVKAVQEKYNWSREERKLLDVYAGLK